MLIEENQLLAPFTTFGIGGPARWFFRAASEDEIAEAAAWAGDNGVALFVLGGGSNILVSDEGFSGLILHVVNKGIDAETDATHTIYKVSAGEDWDAFVERTACDGCAGVECLAGIPGTVGGTPVQNVGAYGQEVASVIQRVRAFDLQQYAFVEFTAAECDFSYRRSRFNSIDRERYIVSRVDYLLKPGGTPTVRYADLQKVLQERDAGKGEPTLTEVTDVVRRVRQNKGMLMVDGDPNCHSAGSFFKNPIVTESQVRQVTAATAKEPPRFPAGPGKVKLPAAWLIEQAGFSKGFTLGTAGISSRHTLALINCGGATAREILDLASQIATEVKARFGIELEMEPVMLGF